MKSILVIGCGRFGRHLAKQMQELGNEVMIVDKDEDLIEELSSQFTDALCGDCTNEKVLRSLGVNDFDICFVAIGDDFQSSLVVTSLLKSMHAKLIVSKAKRDIQAYLLKQIGADEVVYPEKDIAEKLAVRYNSSNIFDYFELSQEYSIYEIAIPKEWIGKTVLDLDVRKNYKVNIIAIKQNNNVLPMPFTHYKFQEKDHIVVIGKSTDVFRLSPSGD